MLSVVIVNVILLSVMKTNYIHYKIFIKSDASTLNKANK
jgi:hypothetical protein